MKKLFVISLVSASTLLFAQGPAGPPPGPPGPGLGPEMGMGGVHKFGIGMAGGKVVTGAPYTAEVTDTTDQTFADGNAIHRTTTGKIARDSKGRTYMQETINEGPLAANGGTTLTFLTDPVAGYVYVINSANKTATRRAFKPHQPAGQTAVPGGGPPRPPRDAADLSETDLGTMTVAGVSAKGTSRTHTIPAGTIGNTSAIVSTSEIWRSPTLQVVVKATHTDPRIGTSIYQLSNIKTVEPAASLFQVPQGYTVTDAPLGRAMRQHGALPPPPPQQ